MKPAVYLMPKVESGIPIPKRSARTKWKTLLLEMKLGQSFVVPTDQERQVIYRSASFSGMEVTTRKIDRLGYRIWRTK